MLKAMCVRLIDRVDMLISEHRPPQLDTPRDDGMTDLQWADPKTPVSFSPGPTGPGVAPESAELTAIRRRVKDAPTQPTPATETMHLTNPHNAWGKARYGKEHPVLDEPLTLAEVNTLLASMDPRVCESILFIGLAVHGRNRSKGHKDLFNHLIHARDTMYSRSPHSQHASPHTPDGVPRPFTDPYVEMRKRAIATICTATGSKQAPSYYARQIGRGLEATTAFAPIHVHKAFQQLHAHDPALMEEIFLLGSAGATRNIITCLQTIMETKGGTDEIRELFGRINLDAFESLRGDKTPDNVFTTLDTAWKMLSGIMHGNDHRHGRHDYTTFFHNRENTLFARRLSTIRWEVLSLVLKYLILSRDPLACALIPHLVRGPVYMLATFPSTTPSATRAAIAPRW